MNPLLSIIFFAALRLYSDIAASALRHAGAPLDTSIQNEADRAVGQAVLWLCAQQHPDGSWGASNRVQTTSMAVCALKASRRSAAREPAIRATLWLGGTVTNRIESLDTHAWRFLALFLALPETSERTALLLRLKASAQFAFAGATGHQQRFWQETVAAAGLGATPAPACGASNRLARVAADWPSCLTNNAGAWHLARLINRDGRGQLIDGNTPLDWRTDLARQVIDTQRRDTLNGCYWNAQGQDGKITETALGILSLLEL